MFHFAPTQPRAFPMIAVATAAFSLLVCPASMRGLPHMTSAVQKRGGGSRNSAHLRKTVHILWTKRGEGVNKFQNSADIIYGGPLPPFPPPVTMSKKWCRITAKGRRRVAFAIMARGRSRGSGEEEKCTDRLTDCNAAAWLKGPDGTCPILGSGCWTKRTKVESGVRKDQTWEFGN